MGGDEGGEQGGDGMPPIAVKYSTMTSKSGFVADEIATSMGARPLYYFDRKVNNCNWKQ